MLLVRGDDHPPSRDLGANSFRTFFRVTLPLSRIGVITAMAIPLTSCEAIRRWASASMATGVGSGGAAGVVAQAASSDAAAMAAMRLLDFIAPCSQ